MSLSLRQRQINEALESQYLCHVLVYSEMLLRWQLLHKRLELLKSVAHEIRLVHKAGEHFQEQFGMSFLFLQSRNMVEHKHESHITSLSSLSN
jgi:hypothetical protein